MDAKTGETVISTIRFITISIMAMTRSQLGASQAVVMAPAVDACCLSSWLLLFSSFGILFLTKCARQMRKEPIAIETPRRS